MIGIQAGTRVTEPTPLAVTNRQYYEVFPTEESNTDTMPAGGRGRGRGRGNPPRGSPRSGRGGKPLDPTSPKGDNLQDPEKPGGRRADDPNPEASPYAKPSKEKRTRTDESKPMEVDPTPGEFQEDASMEEALPTAPNPHKTVAGTDLFSTPAQEMETQVDSTLTNADQERTKPSPTSPGDQAWAEDSTKSVAENLDARMEAAQKDKPRKRKDKSGRKRVTMAQDNPLAYPSHKKITQAYNNLTKNLTVADQRKAQFSQEDIQDPQQCPRLKSLLEILGTCTKQDIGKKVKEDKLSLDEAKQIVESCRKNDRSSVGVIPATSVNQVRKYMVMLLASPPQHFPSFDPTTMAFKSPNNLALLYIAGTSIYGPVSDMINGPYKGKVNQEDKISHATPKKSPSNNPYSKRQERRNNKQKNQQLAKNPTQLIKAARNYTIEGYYYAITMPVEDGYIDIRGQVDTEKQNQLTLEVWDKFQRHLFQKCPDTLLRPHKVKSGHREKALDKDSEETEHPKKAWEMKNYLGMGFYLNKGGGSPSAIIKVNHNGSPEHWLEELNSCPLGVEEDMTSLHFVASKAQVQSTDPVWPWLLPGTNRYTNAKDLREALLAVPAISKVVDQGKGLAVKNGTFKLYPKEQVDRQDIVNCILIGCDKEDVSQLYTVLYHHFKGGTTLGRKYTMTPNPCDVSMGAVDQTLDDSRLLRERMALSNEQLENHQLRDQILYLDKEVFQGAPTLRKALQGIRDPKTNEPLFLSVD